MEKLILVPSTMEERNAFIAQNINLLHSIAHEFQHCGMEYEDVFQEVGEAAAKAMNTFDATRGTKLSTYIVECARNHMRMCIRKMNTQRRTAVIVSLDQGLDDDGNSKDSLLNLEFSNDPFHAESKDLAEQAHSRFLAKEARKVMDEVLTPIQRQVLAMHADGYSQNQIAKAVNLSQGNVSKMIRLATCEVRLRMQEKNLI